MTIKTSLYKVLISLCPVIILVLITLIIATKNYTPGTWQTGWDTLHPEFNFSINFPRHFFGIWQENQGLGSVGGHSHAADVSRIAILYLLSFFAAPELLRYLYLFFTLITGVVGAYFFIYYIIFHEEDTSIIRVTASFLGALYYLFNVGTIQQYIVQLEMYTALYGFLPWYFLFAVKYLVNPSKKALWGLVLVCFLGAPHAYAITVFLGMFGCLTLYLLLRSIVLVFLEKNKFSIVLKRFLTIFTTIILLNSYWLFPSLYFGLKNSKFVSLSNINSQFSDRIFEHNIKHGNLWDLLTNRGFLTDWENYDYSKGTWYKIFGKWGNYLESEPIKLIEIGVVLLTLFGAFSLIFTPNKNKISVLGVYLICALMFLTINPPFGWLFIFLKNHLSVFSEMFRNPYTKFSVELILLYATFFAVAIQVMLYILEISFSYNKRLLLSFSFVLTLFVSSALGLWMLPYFEGGLVSTDIRINIPQEYFDYFSWMNSQEDTRRIANLPIHSFWGWEYYNWGYQGAGFLWFGTKQPLLARDFDRWNHFNEEYYYEMSHAVYSGNVSELESVVSKYGIGFVVVDKNVITLNENPENTNIKQIDQLLKSSNYLSLENSFGNIDVYHVNDLRTTDFYSIDQVTKYPIDYPFQKGRKKIGIYGKSIDEQLATTTIEGTIPLNSGDYLLQLPDPTIYEDYLPSEYYAKRTFDGIHIKMIIKVPDVDISESTTLIENQTTSEFIFNLNSSELGKEQLLSINGENFFNIPLNISDYTLIGTSLVNIKGDITLSLSAKEPVYTGTQATENVLPCDPSGDYEVKNLGDVISLLSGSDTSCGRFEATIYSPKTVQNQYMVEVIFEYQSELGTQPSYCATSDLNAECVRDNLPADIDVLDEDYLTSTGFLQLPILNHLLLDFYAERAPKKDASRISIKNLRYVVYPVEHQAIYQNKDLVNDLKSLVSSSVPFTQKTSGNRNFFVSASIPSYASIYEGEKLYRLTTGAEIDNVENGVRKKYDNGLALLAKDTNVYDDINITKLKTNVSYIVHANVTNKSGDGLVVSIKDVATNKVYLEKKMSSADVFFDYSRKSPLQGSKGIRVGFFNMSVGNIVTENIVKSVELVPFPANWASHIAVTTTDASVSGLESPLTVSKYSPVAYKISGLKKGSILVFNQSFDAGWIALGGSAHGRYEGWANTWQANSPAVYIVFIPGLIQFLCYVLILPLVVIYTLSFNPRKS